MELNKKSIFFTFISILLIGMVLYSANLYTDLKYREKALGVESRVMLISNFIYDLESDIDRGLYISSIRTLFNEVNYITEVNRSYIPNATYTFKELLMNGSINGNTSYGNWVFGNTFTDWMNKMQIQANAQELNLTMNVTDLQVYQEDPQHITVEANISIKVSDNRGYANWTTNKISKVKVSLINFEDPVYSISTKGELYSFIDFAGEIDYVNELTNDTSALVNFSYSRLYVNTPNSPNFLMRMEGRLGKDPSGNGIESLVSNKYIEDKLAESLSSYNRSINDFIFFNSAIGDNTGCLIENLPYWFKLNETTLAYYNVETFNHICS